MGKVNRPPHVAQFLEVLAPIVIKACPTCLFPSVILAQAALESGWNLHAKTLFGIKGCGTQGSVNVSTTEEKLVDGKVEVEKIRDDFAAYGSLEEAVEGYVVLIMGFSRYTTARHCLTPEEMIQAIWRCGYSTGIGYVKEVVSIMKGFGLKEYDVGHG